MFGERRLFTEGYRKMKFKAVSGIMLTLLLVGMLTLTFNIQPVKAEPKTWTVDDDGPADFHTIQEAINAANPEDTIFVRNGTYYENVVVNKAVSLIGENREGTIIDGGQKGAVVRIKSHYVNLTGFTIQNSSRIYSYGGAEGIGIRFEYVRYCNISGNNVKDNVMGIHLFGSSNNVISGNTISSNVFDGVSMYEQSNNNTVVGNEIRNNLDRGINIYYSSYNEIFGNHIEANDYGIWLGVGGNFNNISKNYIENNRWGGIYIFSGSYNKIQGNIFISDGLCVASTYGNVVEDNLVNSKPLIYIEGKANITLDAVNAGQVVLVNCDGIDVKNLNLSNTTIGINLYNTKNAKIMGNNITENGFGLALWSSSNNTISRNNITENYYGIGLFDSFNNNVLGNNITANKEDGIFSDNSTNNNILRNNIVRNGRARAGISLQNSPNNIISRNNVTANDYHGIWVYSSSNNNSIFENNITANTRCGIWIGNSYNNSIYHNNFLNNYQQVGLGGWHETNVWDGGYPSGGNYWSDYTGIDEKSGPNQDQSGSDGIGDAPYVIDANNTDHYPLMNPWGAPPPPSYTLTIYSSPTGVTFTVDGVSRTTPWSGTYSEGASVSLVMPETHDGYVWFHWLEDGDTNRIKTVTIDTDITLTGVFTYVPPPPPVGGKATPINIPMNKPETPTFWIWLSTIIISFIATVLYVKKRKRHTEINF